LEKARSWRCAAVDSYWLRNESAGRADLVVKARDVNEGAMERHWPARDGVRRARRPQRAMAAYEAVREDLGSFDEKLY
jgi:hypothetical protein